MLHGSTNGTVLEVCDTGPGVAVAERERIFERFARGGAATGIAGRGIGLAVVDELVRAHGGTVEAGVAPGGGAAFRVALPAAGRPDQP